MIWIVMPVLAGPSMTEAALADCLAQSVPTRILVINQGVDNEFRLRLERLAEEYPDRIFVWSHNPPLPSLAASWNRALDFVWECGGTEALVVNSDVRLHTHTIETLCTAMLECDGLFVSAVGVKPEQFDAGQIPTKDFSARGGPDFSCFLISKDCHSRFRFDEGHVPCYCEDLTYHRELLLARLGTRIFSINLPFLHYASGTLKTVSPEQRSSIERQIEQGSRAYYRSVWGGNPNQETYRRKGDSASAVTDDSVTTPVLQRVALAACASVDDAEYTATQDS